ncbi:MAG: permease [Sphingobacteriales bacterium]|nr:MAG: permease [Sphingobacteriales bacterium]
MKSQKPSHLIAILSAGALWGFMVFPLRALKLYTAYQILTWRVVIAFLMVCAISVVYKRKVLITNFLTIKSLDKNYRNKILFLIFISAVLITLNWLTFIYVINHISLKACAFAYLLCPLVTALGGKLLLKEPLTNIKYVALALAFFCIVGLATGSFEEIMWSFMIALSYALFLIIQKFIKQVDNLIMLGLQLFIALLLLLPFYFYQSYLTPKDITFWGNVSVISIFFTIVPLLLSLYALEGLPSSTIGISIYINPIISFSIATLYYKEQITQQQLVFYAILFFLAILFNRDILFEIFSKKNETLS